MEYKRNYKGSSDLFLAWKFGLSFKGTFAVSNINRGPESESRRSISQVVLATRAGWSEPFIIVESELAEDKSTEQKMFQFSLQLVKWETTKSISRLLIMIYIFNDDFWLQRSYQKNKNVTFEETKVVPRGLRECSLFSICFMRCSLNSMPFAFPEDSLYITEKMYDVLFVPSDYYVIFKEIFFTCRHLKTTETTWL